MTEQPHTAPDLVAGDAHQDQLLETFVHLADTLVADYDVIEFLNYLIERCIMLSDIDEAGVMLTDPHGHLHAVAASTEEVQLLELFELQNHDGPCLDAFRSGNPVTAADLHEHLEQWPTYAAEAIRNGFNSTHSVPMRLRNETIGAINLLRLHIGALTEADQKLVNALADIATIGVLQERRSSEATTTADGLQHALNSRVRIEQAKGVLAERWRITIDQAYDRLRRYARHHQLGVTVVAEQIVQGEIDLGGVD
jgi:transcriptional regulator with GAF, ATPase, and Fis domain